MKYWTLKWGKKNSVAKIQPRIYTRLKTNYTTIQGGQRNMDVVGERCEELEDVQIIISRYILKKSNIIIAGLYRNRNGIHTD